MRPADSRAAELLARRRLPVDSRRGMRGAAMAQHDGREAMRKIAYLPTGLRVMHCR